MGSLTFIPTSKVKMAENRYCKYYKSDHFWISSKIIKMKPKPNADPQFTCEKVICDPKVIVSHTGLVNRVF